MSEIPIDIYEAEGPMWTDAEGELHCGWPHDGWRVCLRRLGPDSYELVEESKHIDADDGRSSTRTLDRAAAKAWLSERSSRDPDAARALDRHFA